MNIYQVTMLRKIIYSIALFFIPLCCLQAKVEKFDEIVSLGGRCQVAWQLENNGLRKYAYPFDWFTTLFPSLISFIEHNGQNFLDLDKIQIVGAYPGDPLRLEVVDTLYGIVSYHDFLSDPFMQNYTDIKNKYDRRIERFFKLLHSKKRVLFVRQGSTKAEIEELSSFIHQLYPQLNYKILAVHDSEEYQDDWNISTITNNYLINDSQNWQGDAEGWKKILSRFQLKPRHSPRSAEEIW